MLNRIQKNFTITPNELINDETIDPKARFFFVYLCSKPADWEWRPKHLQKALKMSKNTRLKYQNELKEKGWISTKQKKTKEGEWGGLDIILHESPQLKNEATEPDPKNTASQKLGCPKIEPHINNDSFTNNDLFTKTEDPVSLPEQALNYLNEKKPSKIAFKPTAANLKHLKGLFKNFTLDEIKKVIDYKIADWKDSKKMKKYIRPETLFGEKFNSYLVEASEDQEISLSSQQEEFQYRPSKTVNLK